MGAVYVAKLRRRGAQDEEVRMPDRKLVDGDDGRDGEKAAGTDSRRCSSLPLLTCGIYCTDVLLRAYLTVGVCQRLSEDTIAGSDWWGIAQEFNILSLAFADNGWIALAETSVRWGLGVEDASGTMYDRHVGL